MNYTTDPVADASSYYESVYAQQDAQLRAELNAGFDFLRVCNKCDANALADFAPMVNDWDASKRQPRAVGAPMPKRVPTIAEVLEDSLDYGKGPSKTELMQLLLNVAFGPDLLTAQAQSMELLGRMAATWAKYNVDVES